MELHLLQASFEADKECVVRLRDIENIESKAAIIGFTFLRCQRKRYSEKQEGEELMGEFHDSSGVLRS